MLCFSGYWIRAPHSTPSSVYNTHTHCTQCLMPGGTSKLAVARTFVRSFKIQALLPQCPLQRRRLLSPLSSFPSESGAGSLKGVIENITSIVWHRGPTHIQRNQVTVGSGHPFLAILDCGQVCNNRCTLSNTKTTCKNFALQGTLV